MLYVCFGSSPAGTKAALEGFPPLLIMTIRGGFAGALLTVWAIARGASALTLQQAISAALIGILIFALGAGMGTVGQQTVASGIVGVLSALMPLIAACLGYALFRDKPARQAQIGLLIGFSGIGLLLRPGSNLNGAGVLLVASAQVAWALGAVLAPRLKLPEDPELAAGLELLSGSLVLLIASLVLGDASRLHWGAVPRASIIGIAWLVVTAIGGFTAYGFLAKRVRTSVSTTFAYVNPMVAIFLGWFLFSEPLTAGVLIATAVIVLGVFLIVSADGAAPVRHRHHPMTSGHGRHAERR